jgi:chromosomal replication initiator protein
MSPYIIPGLGKIKPMTPAYLLMLVCNFFGTPVYMIKSKSRKRIYANPRFLAMFLMRRDLKMTVMQIGKIFNRDHTTVVHADATVKGFLKVDVRYLQVLSRLENYIQMHEGRIIFKAKEGR